MTEDAGTFCFVFSLVARGVTSVLVIARGSLLFAVVRGQQLRVELLQQLEHLFVAAAG
jgi:hypothetical protein